jgi:predicted outer membrane protein
MKSILIAAAILVPTLVLANDPTAKDPSAQKGAVQTPTQVLNKLHSVSQKGIEKATVAQSNAGNERLKTFAGRQLKDFQKLDQQVLDLAKTKQITLTSMTGGSQDYGSTGSQGGSMGSGSTGSGSTGSTGSGSSDSDTMGSGSGSTGSGSVGSGSTGSGSTGSGSTGSGSTGSGSTGSGSTGSVGSGTTGSTGTTTQTGTANDTRTGTATGTESPDTRMGSTTGTAGSESMDMDKQAKEARWERLRTLRGAEFDSEYLSMVADGARQQISMLEGARNKGDRQLDRLIDSAIKTFRDHQNQAEKLQREIRAS